VRCAFDGKERDFLLHKATFSNLSGDVIGIVGVMLDITERKKAEEALLKAEKVRKKEIHHRIKNNLQVISSLLNLQAEYFNDEKIIEAFRESQNRVASMSLIHEELYKTGEIGNLETFDFEVYMQKLANELFSSYVVGREDISLKMDTQSVFLGMDTGVPLGIIVNELVSNSLKHAFPRGRSGEIQIKLHRISNDGIKDNNTGPESCDISEFLLVVSDNGVGLPENIDFKHTSSLGLQLINILVEQIDGSIELVKGNGTEFRIKFREKYDQKKVR
jgi:two-component sensor histidine kinase